MLNKFVGKGYWVEVPGIRFALVNNYVKENLSKANVEVKAKQYPDNE